MPLFNVSSMHRSTSFQTVAQQSMVRTEPVKRNYDTALSQALVIQVPKRQKSCPAISALYSEQQQQLLQALSEKPMLYQEAMARQNIMTTTATQYPAPNQGTPSPMSLDNLSIQQGECILNEEKPKYYPSKRLLALLCTDTRHVPLQLQCMQYSTAYHLRKEVIRWIHQVNTGFLCFHSETVFMAINLLDRFMEKSNLRWRQRIYQVALGCVYIAGKFNEETREPMISDMVECAKYATTVEKIKKVEKEILSVLCWEIRVTTPQAMLDELLSCLPEARSTPKQRAYSEQVVKTAQIYLDVASIGKEILFLRQ
ncbi:cyclin [Umbelopsis sp. WA50703]